MSEEKEKIKQTKDRSVAYPVVSLNEAIDFGTKLRNSLGLGPYSRDEAARALGHSKLTGPAARKVAALVHYGLLERSGNTYIQSQLSQDIFKPTSNEHKTAVIRKAAIRPKLFQKICERFGGQALPSMLRSILTREGVSENVADEVAQIFTETMRFAELLVNGVLIKIDIESENDNNLGRIVLNNSALGSVEEGQVSPGSKPIENNNDFIFFEFAGGTQLFIPRTKKTSEAIADGELKDTRKALSEFASKYIKEDQKIE